MKYFIPTLTLFVLSFAANADEPPTHATIALSFLCGDQACQFWIGETKDNCAIDCTKPKPLISSFNQDALCTKVQKVEYPTTTAEVQSILAAATKNGMPVKMVGTRQSFNSGVCNEGIVIVSENLNKIIGIEDFNGESVVRLQAGTKVGDLLKWLHERKKSLGFAHPLYPGMTVAGAMATASHGSSRKYPASISSGVRSITIVDEQGTAHDYHMGNVSKDDWRSLTASLGMLGPMTELRLAIQDDFNIHFVTLKMTEKEFFEEGKVFGNGLDCDYEHVTWFPSTGQVYNMCGKKTDRPADPGARNIYLGGPYDKSDGSWLRRGYLHSARWSPANNCYAEGERSKNMGITPLYEKLVDGEYVQVDEVVGPAHALLTSELSVSGLGMNQVTDWSLGIPNENLAAAMKYAKEYFREHQLCFPLFGTAFRFSPPTQSWFSTASARSAQAHSEGFTLFEFIVYEPKRLSKEEQAQLDAPIHAFIREMISTYGARPHMGKNQDWALQFAAQEGNPNYEPVQKFKATLKRLDPTGALRQGSFADLLGLN